MKPITVRIAARLAWWWRVYFWGVLVFSVLTGGLRPDEGKVRSWARRALRIECRKVGD